MNYQKDCRQWLTFVTVRECVADIGTDHAYIPIYLTEHKKVKKAFAMDVNEGPLIRAEEHVREAGLKEQIKMRRSNGLEKLSPGEVEAVIIAGMGGGLVMRILTEGQAVAETLQECILQPQSEIAKVREFLLQNGYQIVQEEMVLDEGKYYPMMRVVPSKESEREKWDETQLRYGKLLLEMRHPILEQYLKREEQLKAEITGKTGSSERGTYHKETGRTQRGACLHQERTEVLCSVKDIMAMIEGTYPKSAALGFDNVGLQAGRSEKEVRRIYWRWMRTDAVIEEAIAQEADMLITHHPLIFSPLKHITDEDFIGRRLLKLIRSDISYYAMHTNYDVLGMAELSGQILGLTDTEVLDVTMNTQTKEEGIGRVGSLPKEMTLEECCVYVKHKLKLGSVKVFGDMKQPVKRLAVSPGSGKSAIAPAVSKGADVLVTGDIGHHEGLDAAAQGVSVIDAGHYGTEYIFMEDMKRFLEERLPAAKIITAPVVHPFQVL